MTSSGLMHNPPHPGAFIRDVDLDALQLSVRDVASRLQVAPSTLNRILQGRSRVTPEMALRLSRCLGRSAKAGWRYRLPMISGRPASTWISATWSL